MTTSGTPSIRVWLGVGIACLIVFALAGAAAPWLDGAPPVCLLRLLGGVPCPACGLTRGCAWLARGEIRRGLDFHPLAPLALAEAGIAWAMWGAVRSGLARWPSRRFGMAVLWGNVALLFAVWALRLATGTLR